MEMYEKLKYRKCQLSDIVNVDRLEEVTLYEVDEEGIPQKEVEKSYDGNHGYDEYSTEYECMNDHKDIMTETQFDGWDEVQEHLKAFGNPPKDLMSEL